MKFSVNVDHSHYLKKDVSCVFALKPVEEETISITIMKLANKNSCGFDGISTNL